MRWLKYHVFTPLMRYHNVERLAVMLEPAEITWHLIYDKGTRFKHPQTDWIHGMESDRPERGWHPASWKDNWFLNHAEIDPRAWYVHLSDDDWYDSNVFDELDNTAAPVMVISMMNGPTPQGGRTNLIAAPENLRGSRIGAQQIVVRGDIAKECRFGPAYDGDWNYIEAVCNLQKPVYVPHVAVHWNYLT